MQRDRRKSYLYGRHALKEALEFAPQVVRKVFLSTEAARDGGLRKLIEKAGVPVAQMKGHEADGMVGRDAAHQGVIAVADLEALLVPFRNFVDGLKVDEGTLVVLLDELTDPQNVGAIVRSAAAFGAAGVLIPSRNQAPITGAVVKASAGMVFRVPLVSIGNVNQTVDALAKVGFKIYALDMEGKVALDEEPFEVPTLVVVGNEGRGIREKTAERADVTLRIPMDPRCESLNASVSAAVVMYAWSVRHDRKY